MAQERIGRYSILEEIASGGQGAVYRAFDAETNQIIALKVLHPSLTADQNYLERFRREASLASSIDHPNVIKIYEVGESDGRHFIAMELLPESLSRIIESSGSLSIDGAASFAVQIADGLAAAHARGVIHRDIKPQNVLIAADGAAKVTDFGIARGEALSTMTATGVMMGTPHYMSPEQALGERVDARADIYSLGCVLYQMLAGEVPFNAQTPLAVLRQHIDDAPRPIRQRRNDVSPQLASVVERAMEKDPARRFANAVEMSAAIRTAVRGEAYPGVQATRVSLRGRSDDPPPRDRPPEAWEVPPAPSVWSRLSRVLLIALLVAAVVGIAAPVAWLIGRGQSEEVFIPGPAGPVVVETVVVEREIPGEVVVETVIVEKPVTRIEKVVETVIVEKQVAGETVKIVETVIVEKPVTRVEKVVETVVVEKPVTRVEKVVETVIVEKVVEVAVVETVIVEKIVVGETVKVVETVIVEKVIEKVVVVTATPARATAPAPSGRFVLVGSSVFPVIFVHANSGIGQEWKIIGWDLGENLLRVDENGEYQPDNSIAKSFEVASDLSSITFKLRDDVEFHDGWGNMTAKDVAWSFNNAMRDGSIFYRVGSLQRYMNPMDVLDDRTVRLNWKEGQFLPWWLTNFSQISSADPWITSKTIVDQVGEDDASQMPIATGPFEVVRWNTGERIDFKAVDDHWRTSPGAAEFTVIEMREPLTMAAAFKTGEIDFAPIPNNLLEDVLSKTPGSRKKPVGFPQAGCINFTGNYWMKTDHDPNSPTFGETVFPRPGFNPDHAWVGDPDDATSMESARKVRHALALAIDRDAILEEIFGGFGFTQAVITVGFGPEMPQWKTEWEFGYDPDRARQLLTEAGYPNGFKMPLFVPADHPRVVPEAGQAIAQYWRDIGVDVDLEISAYAARRPKRFGGVDDTPWYHCGTVSVNRIDRPFDGGTGPTSTFRGFEIHDEMIPLYFENFTEPSKEKRIANNVKYADYTTFWMLQTTFVVESKHYAVGPGVTGWLPHSIDAPIFTNAATVRVK